MTHARKPLTLLTLLLAAWTLGVGAAQSPFTPSPKAPVGQNVSDPFVGRFSDGALVLELKGATGRYRGQIVADGVTYPLEATGDARSLSATVSTPEADYLVTIAPGEGGVIFTADGQQLLLARQAGKSLASPAVPTPPATPTGTGSAQPPRGAWQGAYTVAVYSQSNPTQRQQGSMSIDVSPLPDGTYHVVSTLNDQPLVDIVVSAAGIDKTTGEEQFPLPWNTGQTSLYGIPAQLISVNGRVEFAVQNAQGSVQASFDPSGVLESFRGCEAGQCTELQRVTF